MNLNLSINDCGNGSQRYFFIRENTHNMSLPDRVCATDAQRPSATYTSRIRLHSTGIEGSNLVSSRRESVGWNVFFAGWDDMLLTDRGTSEVYVLRPEGRFDARTAPAIAGQLEAAAQSGTGRLVVDLGSVKFMDSTGLATLVRFMKRCRETGGDLCLANLQQPVRMIFELTRLDSAFHIYPTVEAAVESFAAGRPA